MVVENFDPKGDTKNFLTQAFALHISFPEDVATSSIDFDSYLKRKVEDLHESIGTSAARFW